MIETARGAAPRRGRWGPSEWVATSLWLAKASYLHGDVAAAIGIVEAAIPPLGNDPTRMNLTINRAALLLDVDRAAEALAAVDATEAAFAAPAGRGLFTAEVKIGGSDRQFAWIRACALARLGRTAEAAAAAVPLDTGVEPQEKRFVIEPTVRLRTRWARCTGDVDAAARAYAGALAAEPAGGEAMLELQPGRVEPSFDQTFLAKVRQHPVLAPLLAGRWRPLPDDLLPALNGWRPPPPSSSPSSSVPGATP